MFNQEKIKNLEKRIEELEKVSTKFTDLKDFLMELEKLKTQITSLRGLVNKKLSKEVDEEQDQPQTIKGFKLY